MTQAAPRRGQSPAPPPAAARHPLRWVLLGANPSAAGGHQGPELQAPRGHRLHQQPRLRPGCSCHAGGRGGGPARASGSPGSVLIPWLWLFPLVCTRCITLGGGLALPEGRAVGVQPAIAAGTLSMSPGPRPWHEVLREGLDLTGPSPPGEQGERGALQNVLAWFVFSLRPPAGLRRSRLGPAVLRVVGLRGCSPARPRSARPAPAPAEPRVLLAAVRALRAPPEPPGAAAPCPSLWGVAGGCRAAPSAAPVTREERGAPGFPDATGVRWFNETLRRRRVPRLLRARASPRLCTRAAQAPAAGAARQAFAVPVPQFERLPLPCCSGFASSLQSLPLLGLPLPRDAFPAARGGPESARSQLRCPGVRVPSPREAVSIHAGSPGPVRVVAPSRPARSQLPSRWRRLGPGQGPHAQAHVGPLAPPSPNLSSPPSPTA